MELPSPFSFAVPKLTSISLSFLLSEQTSSLTVHPDNVAFLSFWCNLVYKWLLTGCITAESDTMLVLLMFLSQLIAYISAFHMFEKA